MGEIRGDDGTVQPRFPGAGLHGGAGKTGEVIGEALFIPQFYSVAQAAKALNVAKLTIYRRTATVKSPLPAWAVKSSFLRRTSKPL
jgi:hypothetical protein